MSVYVPLCFWFTKNIGLPRVALPYSEIAIKLKYSNSYELNRESILGLRFLYSTYKCDIKNVLLEIKSKDRYLLSNDVITCILQFIDYSLPIQF
jgi:hypothetical protein